MRILKLILFVVALCLLSSIGYGQSGKVNFGGTLPTQTAWAARFMQVDSALKFLKYATSDSNKVLGFDASGNAVLRTKVSPTAGTGTVTSIGYIAGLGFLISGTNPITGSGTWTFVADTTFLATQSDLASVSFDTTGLSNRINLKEDTANKAENFSVINNTLYPTVAAVNTQINTSLAAYVPYFGATNEVDLNDQEMSNVAAINGLTITHHASNSFLDIDGGFTLNVPANASVSDTNTGDQELTAGMGISLSGSHNYTVTNTAPDQTVTLNNGTGISITGTYPTFTVTNTSPSSGGTVTGVAGTTNRITSTGGTAPVIDISASYVGQTSINTLGTIGTGTWQGTSIGTTYTDAKVVSVSGTSGRISSTGGGTPVLDLVTVNATPTTYGSATAIPIVTVDAYGRATTITTVSPTATLSSITFVGGNGASVTPTTAITTTGTVTISAATVQTVSATTATTLSIAGTTGVRTIISTITAQSGNLFVANPTGTFTTGECLYFEWAATGSTTPSISFDTKFAASTNVALPTIFTASKAIRILFIYTNLANGSTSYDKWVVSGVDYY